jgi:hypothetical protein
MREREKESWGGSRNHKYFLAAKEEMEILGSEFKS